MPSGVFYVNIIGPNGEDNFVRCDPERLTRSSLRLYTRTAVRGSQSKFTPINGGETACNLDKVDVSEPLREFNDLQEQCHDVLTKLGEHGERLCEELYQALDLPRLIHALAQADSQEAAGAVQHIMYGMMSIASRCAKELSETHTQAESMTSAVVGMGSVLDQAPEMNREIYLNWSTSADGLNAAVRRLDGVERELRSVLTEIEYGQRVWMQRMDANQPVIKEAYDQLEAGDDAYILKAFAYRGEPEKRDEISKATEDARSHIAACRGLEKACLDAWERIVRVAHERLAPLTPAFQKALNELKIETRRFSEFEQQYGKGVPRPFIADKDLITEQEYNTALGHLCDEAWAPLACERRLRHLFETVISLCSQSPELPKEVANAIRMAEQYAADVKRTQDEADAEAEAKSSAATQPPVSPEVLSPVAFPVHTGHLVRESGVRVRPEAATDRMTELYDLLTALGYVLTVENGRPFSSFTLESLLRMLVVLGKCTWDEVDELHPNLSARFDADSVWAGGLKEATALQKTSSARWIRFTLRVEVAKLSRTFSAQARATLDQHDLSAESVRQSLDQSRKSVVRAKCKLTVG